MSAMRCMVRLIGWMPPRPASRPGRVTSIDSPARRASSSASSSAALRADSACPTASRTRLMASPAALRWSGGSAPSDLSWEVMLPLLPSRATRSDSSASAVGAASMSASACPDSDSMSLICSPVTPWERPWAQWPWREPHRARGRSHENKARKKRMGKDLRPSPCVYQPVSRRPSAPCADSHDGTRALRRERALRLFGQGRKPGRVVHGDVRQHLAIQGDAGLEQAVHEAAVAHAVDARRRVDAGDPQRTEIALLLLAADVRVLAGLDDGLLGDAEHLAAGVVIALGTADDLLVATARL